jgi:hypothetical protein
MFAHGLLYTDLRGFRLILIAISLSPESQYGFLGIQPGVLRLVLDACPTQLPERTDQKQIQEKVTKVWA